jgi:hypothetical protein
MVFLWPNSVILTSDRSGSCARHNISVNIFVKYNLNMDKTWSFFATYMPGLVLSHCATHFFKQEDHYGPYLLTKGYGLHDQDFITRIFLVQRTRMTRAIFVKDYLMIIVVQFHQNLQSGWEGIVQFSFIYSSVGDFVQQTWTILKI